MLVPCRVVPLKNVGPVELRARKLEVFFFFFLWYSNCLESIQWWGCTSKAIVWFNKVKSILLYFTYELRVVGGKVCNF